MIPKLLFAGGMAGIASWLSTYPVDVIKIAAAGDGVGGCTDTAASRLCAAGVRREGYMVFTRGLTSTLLRAFPVNAATFATVTLILMYSRGEGQGPKDCELAPTGHQAQLQQQAHPSSL
ncbi:hypothetical protein KUCAC02_019385 [Chaenocephalus aceratus]|uniref:Uncharacterized protein n=1 Tax=Chaenocephalus aceratus TaxID=36190 RepID=A0ACB9VPH5_CHAAC|nr:hypothetical protein KUCAC02_019385 [Chaenocephalus aceratus]